MKYLLLAITLLLAVPAFADDADDYRIRMQQEEQNYRLRVQEYEQRRQLEEIQRRQAEQQRQIDEQNRRLESLRRQNQTPPRSGTLGTGLGSGLGRVGR